ncbi:MAG: Murein tripeptide amidase MpaA [Gammaproteobacteria bacterium]|nr:Murein tripeptide amidase MpaA [Gammaproteobacteria bacterium]
MSGTISVSGAIPCGSIDVVDASDASDIQLRLRRDDSQDPLAIGYYYFRVSGARGKDCTFRLINAGTEAQARLAGREGCEDEWTNTGPHVSYDRRHWFRIPGKLEGCAYVFRHKPQLDVCYYSKWAPYPPDRELDLIARCQLSPRVRIATVGKSAAGTDIDVVTIGEPAPEKKVCWILARQHPSETMGGYFIEGLLERMIDENDPIARLLLQHAVLHVVPNMNPDGSRLGLTRTNSVGANLNREWMSPSLERSPEVVHVRLEMERTGVDFCLDVHGDEELRCVFLGGPLEIPSRSIRLAELFRAFEHSWAAASPEYELGHPYPGGAPAEADLRMAWNWIAERFKCLSVLLEQPFKDTSWWQDPVQGWSPERALRLGASLPQAILGVLPRLRA